MTSAPNQAAGFAVQTPTYPHNPAKTNAANTRMTSSVNPESMVTAENPIPWIPFLYR